MIGAPDAGAKTGNRKHSFADFHERSSFNVERMPEPAVR